MNFRFEIHSSRIVWQAWLILLAALPALGAPESSGMVQRIPFPEARSAQSPSIAVMNGTVYAAWRGVGSPGSNEDDQQLYLASFREGQWQKPAVLSGRSMFGPALAVQGDQLFLAWHGSGDLFTGAGDEMVFFGAFAPEQGFRSLGSIPKALSAGPPSLGVYKGVVYGAWRNIGNITLGRVPGNRHWINYAAYDVTTGKWSSELSLATNLVHANSAVGPSLTTVKDKLFAVWRGVGSVNFHGPNNDPGELLIYFASFDGVAWSAEKLPLPTIPGAETAWSPSAAEWNGQLCVGWRGGLPWEGAAGDQSFHFAVWNEGTGQWRQLKLFKTNPPRSAFGPSLAWDSRSHQLWVAWRGEFDSARGIDDQSLYIARFPATGELPSEQSH